MRWPEAETSVTEGLLTDLLSSQFPDIAGRPCHSFSEGFDHFLWRLGDELVVRLPRHARAAATLENELRWLPLVLGPVALRTPLPLRRGRPSDAFAWSWMIATWVDGEPGDRLDLEQYGHTASALATFLRQVHAAAPSDAPRNSLRGVPLVERTPSLESRLPEVRDYLDSAVVLALWRQALAAPAWDGPPSWIHGDVHPGNLIYRNGELGGVVDFGDLCAGDPATDLGGGLLALPHAALGDFLAAYGADDGALLWRTIGWAVLFSVMMAALREDRPTYLGVGQRGIANALALAQQL